MRTLSLSLAVVLVLGGLPACRSPIFRAMPAQVAGPALPEPGLPSPREGRAAFFQGLSDVETPLQRLRALAVSGTGEPRLVGLRDVEAAVQRRFAHGAPGGALREALALGASARSPLTPRAMADLLANAEAERQAFGADAFRAVASVFETRTAARRTYVVELLDRGEGPFRYDFRFAFALERWDLADGSVVLRYDPAAWAATEHVTLFRGVAVIEPAPGGSLVTELMVFGSDVSVPFFLRGRLRSATAQVFKVRLERLWRIAEGLSRR